MAGGTSDMAAAGRLAEAHRALLADPSIQFTMQHTTPPSPPPAWLTWLGHALGKLLRPIGRLLSWLFGWVPAGAPRVILYGVLAILGCFLLWMVATRLSTGEWRWPRRRRAVVGLVPDAVEEAWQPTAGAARALLAEADALAAAGRFAEAIRLLLHRSIEDIADRRPQFVRPALTSRELAAADAIPPDPRRLFAGIARVVERSLFGGHAVGPPEWQQARQAYADFALPLAWSMRPA